MEKNPKKRLGHGIISGWHGIARHPFFQHIQWYRIDSKGYRPVYTPAVERHEDTELEGSGLLHGQPSKKTFSQDLNLLLQLEANYASFDYTIFDQYEGFVDEQLMTVGPPPYWVKPAFPGADHNHLPIPKVYLETSSTAIAI